MLLLLLRGGRPLWLLWRRRRLFGALRLCGATRLLLFVHDEIPHIILLLLLGAANLLIIFLALHSLLALAARRRRRGLGLLGIVGGRGESAVGAPPTLTRCSARTTPLPQAGRAGGSPCPAPKRAKPSARPFREIAQVGLSPAPCRVDPELIDVLARLAPFGSRRICVVLDFVDAFLLTHLEVSQGHE